MRCKHCNGRLAAHDMWCAHCGRQTPMVTSDLAATRSIRETWQGYKGNLSLGAPLGAVSVILGVLPMMLLTRMFPVLMSFDVSTAAGLLADLAVKAILLGIFFPFTLIGFSAVCRWTGHKPEKTNMKELFTAYPRYLGLAMISALYYALIYIICFGLPKFGSDPILRLVWIVITQYWMVLVLPVPVMMELQKLSAIPALRLSYRHFHVVRWNMYLLLLILGLVNALPIGISALITASAFTAAGAVKLLLLVPALLSLTPLAFTLPFSWLAVRDYSRRLLDYELLNQ